MDQRHSIASLNAARALMCPADFREFLERGAVDVLNPDACWSGGITGLKKIANMAVQYYVPLAPHHSAGPLGQIIGAHLCVSIHNFKVMESFWSMLPDYEGLVEPTVTIRNGFLELPTGPGLGVSLNEEECIKRRHSGSRWEVRSKPAQPREFIW